MPCAINFSMPLQTEILSTMTTDFLKKIIFSHLIPCFFIFSPFYRSRNLLLRRLKFCYFLFLLLDVDRLRMFRFNRKGTTSQTRGGILYYFNSWIYNEKLLPDATEYKGIAASKNEPPKI